MSKVQNPGRGECASGMLPAQGLRFRDACKHSSWIAAVRSLLP